MPMMPDPGRPEPKRSLAKFAKKNKVKEEHEVKIEGFGNFDFKEVCDERNNIEKENQTEKNDILN
jgi:hypothetical protein